MPPEEARSAVTATKSWLEWLGGFYALLVVIGIGSFWREERQGHGEDDEGEDDDEDDGCEWEDAEEGNEIEDEQGEEIVDAEEERAEGREGRAIHGRKRKRSP